MGSGSRFKYGFMHGFVFGFDTADFPFAITVRLYIGCVWIELGYGKAYDE